MKRNLFTKSIVVSVALSALLAGCGSTTANDTKTDTTQTTKTITGKAVDGYLQYATVCLDINKDGYCQQEEPSTQTTLDGSFKLDINPEVEKQAGFDEAMLLVYGGKDVDTGSDFRGKLLAPVDAKTINVTPITTLIAKAVQKELKKENRLSKEELKAKIDTSKEQVAALLGLDISELVKDPVADKATNPALIKKALKLQKTIEMATLNGNNDAIEKAYEKLADNLENAQDHKDFVTYLQNSLQVGLSKRKDIKNISENIDKAYDEFDGDLAKVAFVTKEDLKKAKEGKDIEKRDQNDSYFKADFDWDKAYIVSDLEDIGIENPSDDVIAKIKEIHTEIKPGDLKDIDKSLKERDNELYKQIDEALKQKKEQIEKRQEHEKAKKDPDVKVDLKAMLANKTVYFIDTDFDNNSGNVSVNLSEINFNSDVSMATIGDEKSRLKIEGNNIYAQERDTLTFKQETEDFYAFYAEDGEEVKFYKTKEKAELNRAEMEKKIEKGKTSQEGQLVEAIDTETSTTDTREEIKKYL